MPTALLEATEHQARARVALTAALEAGPSHAYLFRGPRGAGKRAAARALAAEILATGAPDPEDARAKIVRLTARGRRFVAEARRAVAAVEARARRELGERRYEVLRDALEELVGAPNGAAQG